MKLDAKAKRQIKKDVTANCAYVYRDGIAISYEDTHWYKGEQFRKSHRLVYKGEIHITTNNGPFVGRLVLHNPTLLLDGLQGARIYYRNKSQRMEEMNITCDSVTLITESGIQVHENIFTFMSSDIIVQNEKEMSITDWEKDDA